MVARPLTLFVYKRKDSFYLRAKSEGYRSRAAYKLAELNQKHRLLRPGHKVIDLGAWPGGWLQVASAAVGETGIVVGVDLQAVEPLARANVRTVQGDVTQANVLAQVSDACGGKADVLLSDLAPKLSGIRERDEARAHELFALALEFAGNVLRPGGTLLAKLFMNPEANAKIGELKARFEDVRSTRPDATRKGSSEFYVIARGFRR